MAIQADEVKQIAAELLAGMLANPHVYPQLSDDGAKGGLEQKLLLVATEMAENLIQHVEMSQAKPMR